MRLGWVGIIQSWILHYPPEVLGWPSGKEGSRVPSEESPSLTTGIQARTGFEHKTRASTSVTLPGEEGAKRGGRRGSRFRCFNQAKTRSNLGQT